MSMIGPLSRISSFSSSSSSEMTIASTFTLTFSSLLLTVSASTSFPVWMRLCMWVEKSKFCRWSETVLWIRMGGCPVGVCMESDSMCEISPGAWINVSICSLYVALSNSESFPKEPSWWIWGTSCWEREEWSVCKLAPAGWLLAWLTVTKEEDGEDCWLLLMLL